MPEKQPQIRSARPAAASYTLTVEWKENGRDTVDMTGVITGHEVFAPLRDEIAFRAFDIVNQGDAIRWRAETPGGHRLDYGADTLWALAEEQRPMTGQDLASTRRALGLSQQELADTLGVQKRTVQNHESAERVPRVIAIALRALGRDRVVLDAHLLRRRQPGRPRKTA